MSVANRDENNIPVIIGVSSLDLSTPIAVAVNPATNALITEATVTIDTTGLATSANQTTIIGHIDGLEGLLTTVDADTSNISTKIDTIAGTVAGTEVQVDVVAALPAGTNAIGKLAANSGVDIGDVDVTSLPKCLQGPSNPSIDSYTHASINLAAGANQVLVSSAANKQIWVYGIGFTVNVAGTVSFQDEDDTAITGVMNIAATSGMVVHPSGNFSMPIWKLATDKDLEIDIVTSELDGWVDYAIVSV